jgi:hypothetical protein
MNCSCNRILDEVVVSITSTHINDSVGEECHRIPCLCLYQSCPNYTNIPARHHEPRRSEWEPVYGSEQQSSVFFTFHTRSFLRESGRTRVGGRVSVEVSFLHAGTSVRIRGGPRDFRPPGRPRTLQKKQTPT